jgi:hypothetical protein
LAQSRTPTFLVHLRTRLLLLGLCSSTRSGGCVEKGCRCSPGQIVLLPAGGGSAAVPMTRPTGPQIWARLLTGTERETATLWCPRFAPPVRASVLRSILFFAKITSTRWHTRPIGRFVPKKVAEHSEARHSEQSRGDVAQGHARPSQCAERNSAGS